MRRNAFRIPPCLFALALCACAHQPPAVDDEDFIWPQEAPITPNGAIFQPGHDISWFENPTAHNVGDTILVHLVEVTRAQKSSSTSTTKATKAELPGPTLFGRPVTANGTEILSADLDHSSGFDGKGDSAQSNTLSGDLTVTVMRRLPNGNLVVRGQKMIGINQGSEYLRVEGVIRPIDIAPDNSVLSSKIANARISYRGKGALADANKPSLLARFFNSPWMPF